MKALPVVVAIALIAAACGSVQRGKAFDVAVQRPARAPTKYSCAAAWNRSIPRSALAWLRGRHVWQGTVEEGPVSQATVSWRSGGPATTTAQRKGQTCTITLFAPHAGARMTWGTWHGGGVASWSPLRRFPSVPRGGGNACVARDGAIRPLGSFTASSRCPRAA
jgi:hypothetical protein